MRNMSIFLILIVSVLWTSCDNSIAENATDFKFETLDKEMNSINLIGSVRYRLKNRLEQKLISKYGRQQYKDSLLIPVIASISRKVLLGYSVGEIYNSKRREIERKLSEQIEAAFTESDIEITSFDINSVALTDSQLNRLRKEYEIGYNSIDECSKEIKGVVTEIVSGMNPNDYFVNYEFIVDNEYYEGVLFPQDIKDKVGIGDSLIIDYACEDAIFHRVKK